MPNTVVRFLGAEPHQMRLMKQAWSLTGAFALGGALIVGLTPGHLGLPVADLGLHGWLLPAMVAAYVLGSLIVTVGDPAYIARQEISFMIYKDAAASAFRLVLLVLLAGSSATGLFAVWVSYVAVAGLIDLWLLRTRLRRGPPVTGGRQFGILREHFGFALGTHVAIVVSNIPLMLLPALTAAVVDTRASAYVAVALQIGALLTVIPSMTGQSLLAELSRDSHDVLATAIRALRGAYTVTLPCAALLMAAAPFLLDVFGSRYSARGTSFLRWSAAGSLFFVFNYLSDTVLLARHKVRDYFIVNVFGTIVFMALVSVALTNGLPSLGPAWFAGQALYATLSAFFIVHHAGRARVRAGAEMLMSAFRRS